jgi:hypothetical protein
MCDLFLLYNDLLRKYLHGVDPAGITLPYLEDLAKSTFADELENLKVLGAVVLLVGLVEVDLKVDLAGDLGTVLLAGLELEPAIPRLFVLDKVGAETDMA